MIIDVAALYEAHWSPIYGFLRNRMVGADDAEVEDLAAQVFERVCATTAYRNNGAPIGSWLLTIARNLLTDRWRRQQARVKDLEITSDAPGGRATADAGSPRHLQRLAIADALKKLTERQRIAIVEQYWFGARSEETALVLGITAGGVNHLRMRARERLYRLLTSAA